MSATTRVRSSCRVLCGLVLIGALASCSTAPGSAETDRVAEVVARAIGSPNQDSADGFVRAALATEAGRDSRLTVIDVEELRPDKLEDPLALLVFRVQIQPGFSEFSSNEPIIACYTAEFSYYGQTRSPRRVNCRSGASPIVPVPLVPKQRVAIPQGFDGTLKELLAALPAAPSSEDVRARVTLGLSAPGVDPNTGLPDLLPTVETAVNGVDVGVSLWEPDTRDCLLGARIGGQVTVGRPSRVQMEPGELSCDPQTALQLKSIHPPH